MKILEGTLISDKMNKSAVVEIMMNKKHPFYQKRMIIKRKIHAENSLGAKTGDRVRIKECRPISKTISFKIVEVLS